MKGASAEPWLKTRSAPIRTIKTIIGVSHHFFLIFKKSQNSLRTESLPINPPPVSSLELLLVTLFILNWRRAVYPVAFFRWIQRLV